MRWAYLFIPTLLLAACAPVQESADPLQEPIAAAIAYLHSEFNPGLQLIRESPITAPDVHWLATDNWLAAHALAAAGEDEFAEQISESIAGYGMDLHGLIEALAGEEIGWPPLTENQFEMDVPGVFPDPTHFWVPQKNRRHKHADPVSFCPAGYAHCE